APPGKLPLRASWLLIPGSLCIVPAAHIVRRHRHVPPSASAKEFHCHLAAEAACLIRGSLRARPYRPPPPAHRLNGDRPCFPATRRGADAGATQPAGGGGAGGAGADPRAG